MLHTLSFSTRHRSIVSLDAPPLPEFVVLTGRNGSGKTHLLEALKGGQVLTSLVASPSAEIQLFDWNTIIPRDTGVSYIPQVRQITFIFRLLDLLPKLDFSHFQLIIKSCRVLDLSQA
jgi:ABC-type branched-subunit amino acid transport system ATPase component